MADRKPVRDVELDLFGQEPEEMLCLVQDLDQRFLAARVLRVRAQIVDEGVELCVCFGGQHPLLGLWVDSSHELPP